MVKSNIIVLDRNKKIHKIIQQTIQFDKNKYKKYLKIIMKSPYEIIHYIKCTMHNLYLKKIIVLGYIPF